MEITSVHVRKIESKNPKHKAIASVVLDDCFAIDEIRIVEGDKGLFLQMPNRKTGEAYKDLAHPINKECREMFNKAIFDEYNNL